MRDVLEKKIYSEELISIVTKPEVISGNFLQKWDNYVAKSRYVIIKKK